MTKSGFKWMIMLVLVGVLTGVTMAQETVNSGPTMRSVLSRGEINCGVNQGLLGFGYLDPNTGEVKGMDVDLCRALAVAVFGDPNAAQLILHTEESGREALADGDLDVLIRNVQWTLSGLANQGFRFSPVTFHNGQTFMVRTESNFNTWVDLDGVTICLTEESPAQAAIDYMMTSRGLLYQVLVFPTPESAQQGFALAQCDIHSADRLQLETLRQQSANPDSFRVWTELYTQEPFAALYRSDDEQWGHIIDWTILGLIHAEAVGITSTNIDDFLRREGEADSAFLTRVGPDIARFVDETMGIGAQLGLAPNFMVQVILQVGNYSEIFNRHLGPESQLSIERSVNRLWRDGGQLYAPDWR